MQVFNLVTHRTRPHHCRRRLCGGRVGRAFRRRVPAMRSCGCRGGNSGGRGSSGARAAASSGCRYGRGRPQR